MAADELSYWDYVKAAFGYRVRLPGLGGMPVNKLALLGFAALGFINPGFWFVGLAGELGYLLFLSGSSRFQRVIQGQRLLERSAEWESKVRAQLRRLDPHSVNRYRQLARLAQTILDMATAQGEQPLVGVDDMRATTLHQLLWIFLRLLISRSMMLKNLRQVSATELRSEIQRLEKRLTRLDPSSSLAKSLQATLDIQRRRKQNLERAEQQLQLVDAELNRIEQQVELIREEALVTRDPAMLSTHLDAISGVLTETSRWVEDHLDFLGELNEESIQPGPGAALRMPGLTERDQG